MTLTQWSAASHLDYDGRTPLTPAHTVTNDATVRENWAEIFARVPDITWEVQRHTVDGDTVWVEAEQPGTAVDGDMHLLRGMVIFEVRDDRFRRNTLYLAPVRSGGPEIFRR